MLWSNTPSLLSKVLLQRSCGKPHSMRAPFCDWHRDAEHTNQRGRQMGASTIRAKEPLGKGRSTKPRDAPNKIHQARHKKQWILPEVLYKLVLEQPSLTFIKSAALEQCFFNFFITLPARTPIFATILGKLSFQKCVTSLSWSNNTLSWPTWNCGKPPEELREATFYEGSIL